MLITNDDQLRAFADRASASPVLAVDTEFIRERLYWPRLCLVQLGTEREQVAVDPFSVTDLAPIVRLFTNPFITKVFHACSQDMEVLQAWCGVLPAPLFDTQVAASYVSSRHQASYATLVDDYCGVSLPKTESLTDWSLRPLDEAQLSYALDDVRYLPAIWHTMIAELERTGRVSWVEPEFARLADPATYRHDTYEAFRRVKRVGTLSRRQLAVAREVAAWREEQAQRADRPRRWLLSDELIVEIAKRMPGDTAALMRIRGLSDVEPADRAQLLEACRRGRECPLERCPQLDRHGKPSVESESVCDIMNALARLVADREGIAPAILASRDDLLGYLAGDREDSPLAQGWRREVLGRHLDDLLEGRVGLTVKDGRVELL